MKRSRDEPYYVDATNWGEFRKRARVADGTSLASAALAFAASGGPPPVAAFIDQSFFSSTVPALLATPQPLVSDGASYEGSSVLEDARRTVLGPWGGGGGLATHASILALDCEMVGVGPGGVRSALAQVVIVDWSGQCVYSTYAKPAEAVTDFRTAVSGVLPKHLANARPFALVQRDVSSLIKGKVLVGHALHNDLKALLLTHPWTHTRDTATYQPFCRLGWDGAPRARKLSQLAAENLGLEIQGGNHDPAEDARAALALYKLRRREWEHGLMARPVAKVRRGPVVPVASLVPGGRPGGAHALSQGKKKKSKGSGRTGKANKANKASGNKTKGKAGGKKKGK